MLIVFQTWPAPAGEPRVEESSTSRSLSVSPANQILMCSTVHIIISNCLVFVNVFYLLSALTHAIAHIGLEAEAKGHHRIPNAEENVKLFPEYKYIRYPMLMKYVK